MKISRAFDYHSLAELAEWHFGLLLSSSRSTVSSIRSDISSLALVVLQEAEPLRSWQLR